ncbi:MAG: extracellular solute-binding protein [bacterium]
MKQKLKIGFISLVVIAALFYLGYSWWQSSGEEKRAVTIRYLTYETQHQQITGIQRIVAAFEKTHPNIKVQVESNASATRLFLVQMASGSPPDVIYVVNSNLGQLVGKNAVLDLAPYVAEDKVDMSIFYPEVTKTFTYGNHLYAYPIHSSTNALIYNRKLFDQAGVPYPDENWTWDDFKQAAKKLTKDKNGDGTIDQFGTLIPDYRLLIEADGGEIFNQDSTCIIDSAIARKAVAWGMEMYGKEAPNIAQLSDTNDTQLFENDRLAMFVGRTWQLPELCETMKDTTSWDIAPIPKGIRRISLLNTGGHCIPKGSKYPRETWEFIKFYSSTEGQRLLGVQKNCVPANKEVALDPNYFLSPPPMSIKVFVDSMAYSYIDIPDAPWRAEMYSRIWLPILDEMRRNSMPVDKGLAELQKRSNEFISAFAKRPLPDYGASQLEGHRWMDYFPYFIGIVVLLFIIIFFLSRRYPWLEGYLFIAPWLLGLLIFILGPIIASFLLSFSEYDILSSPKWIGLKNFQKLFTDPLFTKSLLNTIFYAGLTVPLGLLFSLCLAMLLNSKIRGIYIFRVIYYLPAVTSGVAICLLWRWLYNPEVGLINHVLGWVGIPALGWLTSPTWAMPAIIIMAVWGFVGGPMIIYLAALQGIPDHLYESAEIDGANFWHKFRYVTVPMLTPAIFFNLIIGIINSFQVFTSVYVMTGAGGTDPGGPSHSTLVYILHLYNNAFQYLSMGYACSMAWILFLIILVLTIINFSLSKRWVHYEQS